MAKRTKKTSSEANQYKKQVRETTVGLEGTYGQYNPRLIGSDRIESDFNPRAEEKIPIKKKAWYLALIDWLKNNWIEAVLIGAAVWAIGTVIALDKEVAVLTVKLEQLEEDVAKMSDDMPSKEVFEIRINELKEDLEKVDIDDLKEKIYEIEKEINKE